MEFLETSLNDFDILVVTETHLDNQINDSDITLDSFPNIIHRKDRSNRGGWLLIYSKNDISISRKSELENNFDETIWVEIRSKGQSFLLCNTYRPPCTDIDYWTRLTYAIELALQVNENIIITGDLNSNLLCSNNDKLIDLVNIFNLKNVIDKPTRINGNTSTLLDPIILSDTLNCNYSDVLKIPRHISDHDAAIAFIKCPKATSKSFTRDIWIYDQTDFVRFN
jgi:hypothetical protein